MVLAECRPGAGPPAAIADAPHSVRAVHSLAAAAPGHWAQAGHKFHGTRAENFRLAHAAGFPFAIAAFAAGDMPRSISFAARIESGAQCRHHVLIPDPMQIAAAAAFDHDDIIAALIVTIRGMKRLVQVGHEMN